MIAFAALALFLGNVRFSRCCDGEGQVLFCQDVPSRFRPGYLTLAMFVRDVGEINATVFRSSDLASVTRLRMDGAGVTGIASGAFASLQNLTSVSLTKNLLTRINSDWFGRPAVLAELSLAENRIEVVHESALDGFVGLTTLSLNKNRITTIEPNSFRSQTNLIELDLSENRLTWVSPQVFWSLGSTRIRLDGNPWNCLCGAEDLIFSLKDLQNRSLLDREMGVTCESPPSLRGRPVWDVSVCVTAEPAEPVSVSQTALHKPADALSTEPASSAPTQPKPQTETDASVQTTPTDAPVTSSSHTAPAARPTPEPSAGPRTTDVPAMVPAQTATHVTSPPSETETFIPLQPGPTAALETCVTSEPPSGANTVCALIVVIVLLCLLLLVGCLLAMQRRRKRSNKTVEPGRPEEEENKSEEDGGWNGDRSPGQSESRDTDVARMTPFTGVRAKSANAVLFTSPFCVTENDLVTVENETEAPSEDGKQRMKMETTGESEKKNITNTTDREQKNENQADADRNLEENLHCVSPGTDAVPYLSIGANNNLNKPSADSSGQRSQVGKAMRRISTWPPTAAQWRERCKMKEEEEEEDAEDDNVEHHCVSDQGKKDDETEEDQVEDLLTAPNQEAQDATESSQLNHKTTPVSEAHVHTHNPVTERQTVGKTPNLDHEELSHRSSSSIKAERKNEPKRQGPGNRGTGSTAPPGGASPDDDTLLRGNEYAFMDLLHEVVQNNGRWTRERWKQSHGNKQRR